MFDIGVNTTGTEIVIPVLVLCLRQDLTRTNAVQVQEIVKELI